MNKLHIAGVVAGIGCIAAAVLGSQRKDALVARLKAAPDGQINSIVQAFERPVQLGGTAAQRRNNLVNAAQHMSVFAAFKLHYLGSNVDVWRIADALESTIQRAAVPQPSVLPPRPSVATVQPRTAANVLTQQRSDNRG